jgi:DNA-binding response OmpR family regulator
MDPSASRIANGPLAPRGCALVLVGDDRAALQVVLLLQEFGIAVDVAENEAAALTWAKRARYQYVICGGGPRHDMLAIRLIRAAPRAQVVYLSRDEAPRNLHAVGVQTLALPLDVNAFVAVAATSK